MGDATAAKAALGKVVMKTDKRSSVTGSNMKVMVDAAVAMLDGEAQKKCNVPELISYIRGELSCATAEDVIAELEGEKGAAVKKAVVDKGIAPEAFVEALAKAADATDNV